MKLSQVTALNVPPELPSEEALRLALGQHQLPAQPLSVKQEAGWCPVLEDTELLSLSVMGCELLRFCLRLRKVPRSALQAALKEAVEAYAQKLQAPVTAKERRALAAEVEERLLAQTPPQYLFFWVLLDRQQQRLYVGTRSKGTLDVIRKCLRAHLGIHATPLLPAASVSHWMTERLLGEPLPDGYQLGSNADLAEPSGARVQLRGEDLSSDQVQALLHHGKHATKLALERPEQMQVQLHEDLTLSGLKLLQTPEPAPADADPAAELQGTLLLYRSALSQLYWGLEQSLQAP